MALGPWYGWSPPSCDPISCECCGTLKDVKRSPARTAYARGTPTIWDRIRAEDGGLTPTPAVLEDPNPDVWLCPDCMEEYHAQWDAQWAEYYNGLL